MTLEEQFNFLNFYIGKHTGSYYTVPELTELLDRGQMSVFNDLASKASTSQRIKDALSPFKSTYSITPSNSHEGVVTIPESSKYLHLLDFEIRYAISGRSLTKYVGLQNMNEDERSDRLNSQINPVTVTNPVLEQTGKSSWKLMPSAQYFGTVSFYRRPLKPVFGYNLISGRVIVYDPNTSTELEWLETQHTAILIKALGSIGINLGEGDVMQWAQAKSQESYLNQNNP